MSEILNQLEINSTLFSQLFLFFIVFLILRVSYFKPFMELIDARKKRTVSDQGLADEILTKANTQLREYQEKLHQAKVTADQTKENAISKAKKEEFQIITKARDESKKITLDTQDEILSHKKKLKEDLSKEVTDFSKIVLEKILKRKI